MPREKSEMQKTRKRQMGRRWGLQEEMEGGLIRRIAEEKREDKRKRRIDMKREDLEEYLEEERRRFSTEPRLTDTCFRDYFHRT